jgi:hypothetical protein
MKKLYMSESDKKIFGVCGGIGQAYDTPLPQGDGEIVCHERLGGLLKSYRRAA